VVPKPPALPEGNAVAAVASHADSAFIAMRRRAVGSRVDRIALVDRDYRDEDSLLSVIARQFACDFDRATFSSRPLQPKDDASRDELDAHAAILDRVFDALGQV
jgi:hypothetical protein